MSGDQEMMQPSAHPFREDLNVGRDAADGARIHRHRVPESDWRWEERVQMCVRSGLGDLKLD